jgi:hypothetical protein
MKRKQNKYMFAIISIALIFTANQVLAQQVPKRFNGPIVTQNKINVAGGYKFTVPGVGKFVLSKVYSTKDPNKKCRVDLSSVKKIISKRYKNRKAKPVGNGVVILRTWHSVPDDEITCSEPGQTCYAKYTSVRSNVVY